MPRHTATGYMSCQSLSLVMSGKLGCCTCPDYVDNLISALLGVFKAYLRMGHGGRDETTSLSHIETIGTVYRPHQRGLRALLGSSCRMLILDCSTAICFPGDSVSS
jgi:hypothetical protein